ncbi:hypothetical protein GCM10027277_25870 [Pseudoduganella ginsengisoli]
MVEQQLSGIGIAAVWDILVAACKEIALYYGGAVVAGAALGGAIGSVALGVGAIPGAAIGTAAGAQVATWIMALMGLKQLAEGLASMLPAALDQYERGFREAWGAAPDDLRDTWKSISPASGNTHTAAWHLSQGHVIMMTAILAALVTYLTRGRGNKASLLQEIRQSPRLGPRFAEWLIGNERKLLGHPQLQVRPGIAAAMKLTESATTSMRRASSPKTGINHAPNNTGRTGFTGAGETVINDPAEMAYSSIRSKYMGDIAAVSANTGLSIQEATTLKKHLFFGKHAIPEGGTGKFNLMRFSADDEIAFAWMQAQKGPLSLDGQAWFQQLAAHELGERSLMAKGIPYRNPAAWDPQALGGAGRFNSTPPGAHDLAPPQPGYGTFPGFGGW